MDSTSENITISDSNSEQFQEEITYSQGSTVTVEQDNESENLQAESTEASSSQNTASVAISVDDNEEKETEAEDQDERPSKKPKLDETIDEEGSLCVICYEVWDQTGDHRISALKCGHLFGHKCILRWMGENKVCPTCKTKATKKDIRFIYANKLIAMDTGELTRLQKELDGAKTENNNLQIELTSVLCKLALMNAEIEKYKFQIEQLKTMPTVPEEIKPSEKGFNLKYFNSFVVCPQASCRVMDCLLSKTSIIASLKSGNNLFPGYGVKQFNSETFASFSYTPLHTKAIRDLRFNQMNARLLSVSLDKHFSIANIYSNETNIKQSCNDMLWSCCWDSSKFIGIF